MWTHFFDMHSGGSTKIPPYNHLFIEAPKDEAVLVFYNRYGRHPNKITCSCCGEDYSVYESETLEDITQFQRKWGRNKSLSVEEFCTKEDVLIVKAAEILPAEKTGELSDPGGWVWMG